VDQAVVRYLCLLYLVDQGLYICRNEGGDKFFLSTLKGGSSTQQDVSWGAGGGARGGSEQGREAWGEQGGATGCRCWTGEKASISVMCCLQDSDGEDQNYKSPSYPGHTYSFPSTPLPTLVLTSTPPIPYPLLTLPTLSQAPPHSTPHTYFLLSTLRTYTCPPLHPSHSIPHSHTYPSCPYP